MTESADSKPTQPPTAAMRAGRVVGSSLGSVRAAAGGARRVIRRNPKADRAYRTAVGVTGGATVALGVALIPLPGPGTLIALGGLAMLGSEFDGAKKVSTRATAVAKKAAGKIAERRTASRTGDAS